MSETKSCSACGEEILSVALKCKFCGEVLDKDAYQDVKGTLGPPPPGLFSRPISGLGVMLAWVGGFGSSCIWLAAGSRSSRTLITLLVLTLLFAAGLAVVIRDIRRKDQKRRLFPITVFGCIVVTGLLFVPWFLFLSEIANANSYRAGGNETAAIGALKTIGTAQSLFRESDKEADGTLDYGTLSELASAGTTGLIDSVLGSGTKNGYVFATTYGASTSEFIWFAIASPAVPATTGDRYFCTNHEGVIFYTTQQPFELNSLDCTIPAGVRPVGK